MLKDLKRIPLLRWLKLTKDRYRLLKKNADKGLILGFNNWVEDVEFGYGNRLSDEILLSNCKLGDYSYVNSNSSLHNTEVGKFSCIGENVVMGLGKHPIDLVSTHPAFYTNKQPHYFSDKKLYSEYEGIVIGNDVWVGSNSVVLDGVSVGDGAIVAAGAVVTKNVEPYMIVGGVPAKEIKRRFKDATVEKLRSSQWWNWPLEKIRSQKDLFLDVDAFLKATE